MKALLRKDWVQRAIYILGLLILIFLSFKDGVDTLSQESSLGVKYWYFFIVPCVVIVYQIIFNNKIGWFGIMSLYSFYLLWYLRNTLVGIKEKMGYFGIGDYVVLIVVFLILIMFGIFFFSIKPSKTK